MHDMMSRVLAGLRQCKRRPDALVCIDGIADETWDMPTVGDIPVLYATQMLPPFLGTIDCRFFPVWKDNYTNSFEETRAFVKGYCSPQENQSC